MNAFAICAKAYGLKMSMSILAVPVFAFMIFVTKSYGRDFVQAPAMENKRERLDCGGFSH
jgi:hypothetical protein